MGALISLFTTMVQQSVWAVDLLAILTTFTINALMNKLLYLPLALIIVGCGNASQPKSYDMSDTALVLPETFDTTAIDSETKETPKGESKVNSNEVEQPVYHPTPKSDEYDEGYHKGYADGEEDGYTHSGYQATYDDSNDYDGRASDEYEKGYSEGYEAGYDDNVEYEDD